MKKKHIPIQMNRDADWDLPNIYLQILAHDPSGSYQKIMWPKLSFGFSCTDEGCENGKKIAFQFCLDSEKVNFHL